MIKFYDKDDNIITICDADVECCFRVIKSEKRVIDGRMVRVILEAKLMETSVVGCVKKFTKLSEVF